MKKGKRLLFATLFMMLVAAMFSFVACGGKKETTTPSAKTGGAYYLSVYEDGQWTTYTAESNVPAARKFAQDATDKNTYKLSIALEEGAKVKIAQVGSTATYGGKELFTARTELTKGTDNALEVSASGTYGFTFDSSDKTISYSFKAKEEGNTGDDRTVLLVEINEAGPFTLTYPATKTLTATVTYDGDAPEEDVITWSSSNKSVATVDEHGVVTAVSAGTTQITAKSGEVDSDPVTINVEGTVTLNETTKTLRIGETLDLEATVAGGATLGDWVSSTPAVASVEEDENDKSKATVTAVAGGETTISLTYLARTGVNKTAICTVKVEQPVTDMTVASSLTVRAGGNQTLTVSFTPEDATNKNYAFAVAEGGDEFITVTKNPDNTLNIAGVKETTAPVVITITSEYDNTIVKTCNVTVVAADANYANINATSLNLNKSDTAELTVDGVGIASVVWTTSSSAVATFVEDTEDDTVVSLITVTAAGFGTATLTATITFDDDEHTTTTRECVVLVMPDQMWVYGDIIEGSSNGWDLTSSYELAQASGTTLAKEGNTYTANIHLTANKDFRIGHDGFDWKGIRWEHISEVAAEKQNVVEGGNDQNGGKNVRVTVAGVYNITVDFSGTKPVLKITIVSVDIVSIVVAAQGNTTLTSSSNTNSVVIKLTINPADAGYEEIVWTSDDNGALVSLQPNEAKDELTVTALDDLTAGGDVTITCTVKSVRGTAYDKTATVALTVVEKGGVSTPVTDVLFDTNGTYTYDVNGQDTWTLSVKAEVNADATNKGVTYKAGETYGDHFQISTSNGIGYITVTRLGTYKIIAEADDNPEKTDEVYVTFYSSQFYVSGGVNGWGTLKPGATSTEGSNYENYTFTANEAKNVFTLENTVFTSGNLSFAIVFCSSNGWNEIVAGATLTGLTHNSSNNNFSVASAGVYTIVVDMSTTTTTITATRNGNIPTYTAKLMKDGETDAVATSGESSVLSNRYYMDITATFAADAKYTVQIGSETVTIASLNGAVVNGEGDESATKTLFELTEDGKLKCVTADQYRLVITYNPTGNTCTIAVETLEDKWVTTNAFALEVWYYGISDNDKSVETVTYYNGAKNEYRMYFTYNVISGNWFNFYFTSGASANIQPKTIPNVFTNNASSIIGFNNTYDTFEPKSTGTVNFEVVFTINGGEVSFTSVTADTNAITQPTV